MEQNNISATIVPSPSNNVNDNAGNKKPKNSSTKWKIATIITLVIAFCGIGFSVYSVIQNSQKDNQISDLKAQLEKDDKTAAEVTKDAATAVEDSIAIAESAATTSGGPYIQDGYFYVPEWGLKFLIPNDLANYGYSVNYDTAQSSYPSPGIGFTAMLKSDERPVALAHYYDSIETCSIVNVSKEPGTWPANSYIDGTVKQFDDYALLIWNYSRHDSCDYKLHIDEVQAKIQTMFQNPENIVL